MTRLLALATLLLVLMPVGGARAETRIALVIGNAAYSGSLSPLENPVNDAELIADALKSVGFDVISLHDASQKEMKRAIAEFGAAIASGGKDVTGLFYYAGHGLQAGGTNYLVPVNAEIAREGDVDLESVTAESILRQMELAGATTSIVILDACRNNPLARGFRSASRGLARMDAPNGSFLAYSTAPGDVAADGEGRNSPFARALASEMKKPDQAIEITFRNVRIQVMNETSQQQVPWDSSSMVMPFYFVAPVKSTLIDRIDSSFWRSTRDSPHPDDFVAYLTQFPNGKFVDLAKVRYERLTGQSPAARTAASQESTSVPTEERRELDLLVWESFQDTRNADDLIAYLKAFPDGAFAKLAKSRLRSIIGNPEPIGSEFSWTPDTASVVKVPETASAMVVAPEADFASPLPDGTIELSRAVKADLDAYLARVAATPAAIGGYKWAFFYVSEDGRQSGSYFCRADLAETGDCPKAEMNTGSTTQSRGRAKRICESKGPSPCVYLYRADDAKAEYRLLD
jgi:hypothetical protein